MKTIEIVVDKDGNTKVTTKGYAGGSCQDASKFLESIGQKTGDVKTGDYYQTDVARLRQRG